MNEIITTFEKNIEEYFNNHPTNRRLYKNISKKILILVQDSSVKTLHNKLLFTYDNWKTLDAYQYIKERRQEVHYLVNNFIEYRIIHTKSDPFPKNLRLYSINKLPTHFLNTYLPHLDSTLHFKKKITDTLNSCPSHELEKYLYLYLYLFSEKYFTHFQLVNLHPDNHFFIEKRLYFILPHNLDKNTEQPSYDIIDFNPYISMHLKRYLDSLQGENLFSHNHIPPISRKDYIHFINIEINKHDDTLGIKIIKDAIKLDTQLNTSPYFATIFSWKTYPRQTLIELDRLYPSTVPKVFLNKEIALQKNKNTSISTKEADPFDNLEEYLKEEDKTFEIVRTLPKLKTNPNTIYKKKITAYIKPLQKIVLNTNCEIEQKIASYLIDRLQSILGNTLQPQTFKSNLQKLNEYILLPALYSKRLSNDMFIQIQQKIHNNNRLGEKTKAKYIQILNHFFTFSYAMKIDTVIANSYTHRSMVFDDELTILVDNIIEYDRQAYNIKIDKRPMNFYKSRMRSVFLILLRYSGLRLNELRSRRLSDWYRTNDGYAIDVNKEGFKQMINLLPTEENKGLKNRAARRTITFSIDNPDLKEIVDKFYDICQDMDKKFVFSELTEQTIHSRPVPMRPIDKLNKFMQKILNREVVLHSLRHSFVTYNIAEILANDESSTKKEVFELCNMTGQSDPTVMINNYLHIEHLRHLIQRYKIEATKR